MKKALLLACLGAFLVAGCETPTASRQPAPRLVKFDEAEFQPYAGVGSSAITGQAFLKTRGGDVKFGAGCEVLLIPFTTYTQENVERVDKGEALEALDPRYFIYRKKTLADGNGNFEFRDIPAGAYYLACSINWEAPGPYGLYKTGGWAITQTSVAAGETIKVILTR